MRRIAAVVAIALLLLTVPLVGAAVAAPAQLPAASGPNLQLTLDGLAPRVVTTAGSDVVTMTGTIVNLGTEAVSGLAVRLQRGDPLHGDTDARAALDGRDGTDAVTPAFTDVPGELAPGARVPVRLDVSVGAATGTGLGITRPGVYPVLVNVNGEPDGAPRARLAATRLLLPVLGVPGTPTGTDPAAAPFTLLYPVADVPHRLPTVPGETPTLGDDDLAGSFAPGGRLDGLVTALTRRAPVGSPLRAATCVAVDPDLLQTAEGMRGGYQVRAPDGSVHPGAGADAAGRWLDGLVAALTGGCVVSLPFADADLVAMTRAGYGADAVRAVTEGTAITEDVLGVAPTRSILWPADGLLDDATLAAVAPAGVTGLVLAADGVDDATTPVVRVGGSPGVRAVLADPLLTAAATPSDSPRVVAGTAVTSGAAAPGSPLSTQDTIGMLAYRAVFSGATAEPVVLAPPHRWAADATGADALLAAAGQLVGDGHLRPEALPAALAGTVTPPAEALFYPARAGASEVPPSVVDRSHALDQDVVTMSGAAISEPGTDVTPADVFDPLRRATLRPVSAAWRGDPVGAVGAADRAEARIDALRASVRVLEPPGPYSLGSSDAPLLLTVANGLPVALDVRVVIVSTAGLRVAPIPDQRIPPLGRIQVRANAQVVRAGQFAVDAVVQTPQGSILGPATRLQVRSTAYGTVTVWITAIAGGLLILLVTRRLLRRRGRRGTDPPDPGPAGDGPRPPDGSVVPPVAAAGPRAD